MTYPADTYILISGGNQPHPDEAKEPQTMSACKTYTIIVDEQTGDRIEYEYDRSDRAWNVYAIDGQTGYPIHSSYAGSKAERDIIIRDEAPAWFEDEDERSAARAAFEMFGKADNDDAEAAAATALQDAARSLINAYAEAIGEHPTEDDPETRAAYAVSRACIGLTTATDDDRATDDAMVEAIAERTHAAEAIEDAREAWTGPDYYRIGYSDGGMDATNDGSIWYETAADLARDLRSAYESATDTHLPYAERIERPAYQRYELEAFLGDYADDYDADAIEAEATEYDPATGRTVWTPEAVRDLWSICERHELKA